MYKQLLNAAKFDGDYLATTGAGTSSVNGSTLDMMQHQIDQFSKADVTFIHVRKDAAGAEIELVTNRDLEDFVVERLAALGTQIK